MGHGIALSPNTLGIFTETVPSVVAKRWDNIAARYSPLSCQRLDWYMLGHKSNLPKFDGLGRRLSLFGRVR